VVSLLLVFVVVRVGVRPSIKGWKDQAEVVALGFTLTLKLHDMVHSYLTAKILLSIDDEQRRAWQATIDQSDNFLVGLFIAVMVFVVLRVSMDIFTSGQFKRLLEKRRCRLCLLRMCCGCKCKLCRLCCPGISLGGVRRGGSVEDGTIGPRCVSAIEMYRLSSVDRLSIVDRAGSARSASSGRFGTGDNSDESVGDGVGVGQDSVVPLPPTAPTIISRERRRSRLLENRLQRRRDWRQPRPFAHSNPTYDNGRGADQGAGRGAGRGDGRGYGNRLRPTESALELKQYAEAHREYLGRGRQQMGGDAAFVSFIQDVVVAAREEEEEGEDGKGPRGISDSRCRAFDACFELFDERTLNVLGDIVGNAVQQRCGADGIGGDNSLHGGHNTLRFVASPEAAVAGGANEAVEEYHGNPMVARHTEDAEVAAAVAAVAAADADEVVEAYHSNPMLTANENAAAESRQTTDGQESKGSGSGPGGLGSGKGSGKVTSGVNIGNDDDDHVVVDYLENPMDLSFRCSAGSFEVGSGGVSSGVGGSGGNEEEDDGSDDGWGMSNPMHRKSSHLEVLAPELDSAWHSPRRNPRQERDSFTL
jgi:hypothetical protein